MSPGPCLCNAEKHASWGRETAQPLLHALALRTFPLLDEQVKGFPHDRGFCWVKSGANEAGEGADSASARLAFTRTLQIRALDDAPFSIRAHRDRETKQQNWGDLPSWRLSNVRGLREGV